MFHDHYSGDGSVWDGGTFVEILEAF